MNISKSNADWKAIIEESEIAFLRADVCIASPHSFDLEEKRAICEGIDAMNAKAEQAMRDDFNAMPPRAQARMLELLAGADPGNMDFWKEVLGLKMPDAPPISS